MAKSKVEEVVAVEATEAVETKKAPKGVAKLEEEGDIAADYLEALLDIADLDGDIDIDVENDRAALAIVGGWKAGPPSGPRGRGSRCYPRAHTPSCSNLNR